MIDATKRTKIPYLVAGVAICFLGAMMVRVLLRYWHRKDADC